MVKIFLIWMAGNRNCNVCGKILKNFIDAHKATIYVYNTDRAQKHVFNLTLCYKHHTEFFLHGQYQFLKLHETSLVNYMRFNNKKRDLTLLIDTLNFYEGLFRKQNYI